MKYVCMNCKDRYPGCHDHCEKYQKIKQKHDKAKNRNNEARYYVMDHFDQRRTR